LTAPETEISRSRPLDSGFPPQFALLGETERLLGQTEQSSKNTRRFLALLGETERVLALTEQSKLRGRATF
jgi:hypothetical protein